MSMVESVFQRQQRSIRTRIDFCCYDDASGQQQRGSRVFQNDISPEKYSACAALQAALYGFSEYKSAVKVDFTRN